tara:strand:+ start:302 stop:802 length:501 start_codon:yes stop_codon:yes gene_type:complete
MELKGMLQKLTKKENPFSKLNATEKAFATAYRQTLGDDATSKQLERAKSRMDSLDLSAEQKSNIKDMIMKDYNKEEDIKEAMKTPLKKDKGGNISKKSKKKDKIAIMIAVGKPKMAYGGSVKGKKHFYSTGGSVKDNAGLIALGKQSPSTYKKITGREFKNGNKTT